MSEVRIMCSSVPERRAEMERRLAMRNRFKLWMTAGVFLILAAGPVRAAGDWKYFSRYALTMPLETNAVALVVKPEWRFRNGMGELYLVKPEFGLGFKLNRYLEFTPYYVYQDAKTAAGWSHSDLSYLDGTLKFPLPRLYDLKVIDRLRNQYNWDKKIMVWRNSVRLTRAFAVRQMNVLPFIEEEIFYNQETVQFSMNWASAGLVISMRKYLDFSVSYLLETERTTDGWANTNVLVSSLSLRF